MSKAPLSVVTGAFGYSGKYITRRLLARGERWPFGMHGFSAPRHQVALLL